MKKINVPLKENPYQVLIGNGIFSGIAAEIKKRKLNKNILIITDSNVNGLYRNQAEAAFQKFDGRVDYLVLRPGENSKSPETLEKIYSYLLSKKYGRDTLIAALGGGVIGDISGFAASTFMRGTQFIQVPTTLLAACDSSIGGKTGINFKNTKNIIGTFYQPEFVLTDLGFLKTLPQEEVLCGVGEILKYAFLSDQKFYAFIRMNLEGLLSKETVVMETALLKSVKIKSEVVAGDEKEAGLRKILNLGHTFAHAYESVMDYKIKHGEAVIAGLACALILSRSMGLMDEKKYSELSRILSPFNPAIKFRSLDKNRLYMAMLKDKKNRNGKIKFVLLQDVGRILPDTEAEKKDVFQTLDEAGKFFTSQTGGMS